MKNKKLIERIEKFCDATEFPFEVYFSEIIPDARYAKYKYFFKYHNTHSVAKAFKTQKEIKEFLEEEGF